MPISLNDVEREIRRLAAIVGAPDQELPTFGFSQDGARPHIEIDDRGLHYVVMERGMETLRKTTRETDELYYLVFKTITFALAGRYELAHRIEKQDCRRIMFEQQLHLLAKLRSAWADRLSEGIERILCQHPFDDLASPRAEYCRELRAKGLAEDEIWRIAVKRFPLSDPTAS